MECRIVPASRGVLQVVANPNKERDKKVTRKTSFDEVIAENIA